MSSPPAGRPATLRDVAELAGVHPATASRALQGSPVVKDDTAQTVLQAALALGYTRNLAAAALRSHRSHTIGVLTADLADPLVAPLVDGTEAGLREAGYMMLTSGPGRSMAQQRAALSGMLSRCVDGVIITTADRTGLPSASLPEIPAAAAGHASSCMPSASADLTAALRMVAEHLASLGHRTIACVSCVSGVLPLHVLVAAIRRAGLIIPPALAATALAATAEEGRRCCRELLAARPAFTAIIAGSDILAAGCCAALAAAGRSCPADVSVTGFGDLPLSGSLTPPLTTVQLPQYDVGAAAARLLLAQLHRPAARAESIQLAPSLLVRDSTGACR